MIKAGWASCDITPPLGLPMGGRGPRFALGSEVLNPLEAGAIALEDDNGKRIIIVSVDLISLGRLMGEDLTYRIGAATNASPDAVIINTSHTHSGPMMGMERYATLKSKPPELLQYEAELETKLVRLAIDAVTNLQEVRVFWRDGKSNIGINRRLKVNGETVMAPNPEGHYHQQLWTLELKPTNADKGSCILFSHGCHPVILYSRLWTTISSEWPGRCRNALRKELGENTHCQFMQGLAGNIRPRILSDFENIKFRKSVEGDVEAVGQEIAQDVLNTLQTPVEPLPIQLNARRGWFTAQRGEAPPQEYWQDQLRSDDELTHNMAEYWLTRYGANAIPPYPAQPWPIGIAQFAQDHALIYVAGEPLSEWYDVFQKALPHKKLVACGYTHAGASYLPTDALLKEGGYEITRSPAYAKNGPGVLQPGLDQAVTKALQEMDVLMNHTFVIPARR